MGSMDEKKHLLLPLRQQINRMSNEDTFYFQKIGTCADDFFFNK